MPYDPRMLQMAQAGVRMMGPEPSPFDRAPQQKQWWEQPLPMQRKDQPADQSADPSQAPNRPKQPPSMFDMMMGLGKMTRPEYDKAISGPSGPYGAPGAAAQVSPWAWLGSMGSGGPR